VNTQEFHALIDTYLAGKASQEEIDLLGRYYNSFQQKLDWNNLELGQVSDIETEIFDRIQKGIKANDREKIIGAVEENESVQKGKNLQLNKRRKVLTFTRIAAAACIIGLLVVGSWVWFQSNSKKEIAHTNPTQKYYNNDSAAGGDKAILKLADGSTIILDDAQDGALAQQGNAKVIKLNGKLSYNASSATNKAVYNTISTPAGGKYEIELADGSHVWLNAASSLHFPTAFIGKERRVEITGEAYLEVARNKTMPFLVTVNGSEIQVLGTHFDVMAYNNETSLKTTLLEGAIKFVRENKSSVLKPGEQLQLSENGALKVVTGVDVEEAIAWKNGLFDFNGADIGTVSRQLERWYAVKFVYDQTFDDQFYAKIPRSTKLSEVLKLLELTEKVHFEINGSKVFVTP